MDDLSSGPGRKGAVRILIADDHELVRRGLSSILAARRPEWEVVAEAPNGLRAIELAAQLKPDVAVLDLSMPGKNGIEVAQQLQTDVPGIRILVLTMHTAGPILRQLKRAGVNAYMIKSNKQVAADLDMSVRTAETHRANILAKLGAHSIGDLVRIAIRDGVVESK